MRKPMGLMEMPEDIREKHEVDHVEEKSQAVDEAKVPHDGGVVQEVVQWSDEQGNTLQTFKTVWP